MIQIQLYSTLSRSKTTFQPIDAQKVRMYVCGPTVYDFAHIGNARPVLVFDTLFRLLRHVYGENHVLYARNITDVDDKINTRAAEMNITIRELTTKTAAQFEADMAALNALPPSISPRATEHIPHMIAMIETLIAKGHAYEAQGHVLFKVGSCNNYGTLSNRSLDEMLAGARVEIAPYKQDAMDFVLWKPSIECHSERSEESHLSLRDPSASPQDDKHENVGWNSPWGSGRPGWHIECSAMAKAYLGDVFDIHAGGLDLIFPHHENEIAQSCCANGNDEFARYWLHNGFLQVEGEKMSKSLGNFRTVNELLQQWPAEAIRLCMLMTHYRQPLNWTEKSLQEAVTTLDNWYAAIGDAQTGEISPSVLDALCDDINTPKAIAELHGLRSLANKGDEKAQAQLKAGANMMGLLNLTQTQWLALRSKTADINEAEIQTLVDARTKARLDKNWAEADTIRKKLNELMIEVQDNADGSVSWKFNW